MCCIGSKKKTYIYLGRQLSKLFAGLYLSAFVITMTFWFVSVMRYQKEREQMITDALTVCADELESDLDWTNTLVRRMYLENRSFHELCLGTSGADEYEYIYDLMGNMELQVNLSNNIDGLFIYYDNYKKVIYKMSDKPDWAGKKSLLENNQSMLSGLTTESGSFIQHAGETDYETIYYVKNGTAIIGLINLSAEASELENTWNCRRVEISDTRQLEEGKNRIGSDILYVQNAGGSDCQIIFEVAHPWRQYIAGSQLIIFTILLFSTVPAAKLYMLLKRQILEPLKDMTRAMQEVQNGTWDVRFHVETNLQEIEDVKKALEVMTTEIAHWKVQTYEEKIHKQHAQLQYLQLQLNPHFYINCLKLIQAKLQQGYWTEADDFIIHLSVHFRYLMKKGMDFVKVSDELLFTDNYLELMKELFPGKVRYHVIADETAKEKQIPMLAIQTFVENSLKYARKTVEQELQLMIKIQYMEVEEGEFLNLQVRDNGVGYSGLLIPELNDRETNEGSRSGIANLKNRIELLYKDGYSWYFYNQQGAVSEILLPCIVKEGE